jgi:hypothetical protein
MARRALLGVAAAIGIALAACGSSTPNRNSSASSSSTSAAEASSPAAGASTAPGSSAPANAAGAVTFSVRVALTGKDAVSGSFIARAALAPGVSGCVSPSELTGNVGGHHVDLQINTSGGVNQQASLSPGDVNLIIDSDIWGVGSSANAPQGTSGTLQRSITHGALAFQDLYLQSNPAQVPQESGSITWTCP